MRLPLLFLACPLLALARAQDWTPVDNALQKAIASNVFPGCVAGVANADGQLYLKAFGSYTYGDPVPITGNNPQTTIETLFDMASLTKVTATTTAAALFYQRGELDLNMPVADTYLLGPSYAQNGKENITVRNLLLHNSGYPPDPVPGYSDPTFGCPATSQYHPPEDFSCLHLVYPSLLAQTLINPVGEVYVYSDLSMITMEFILGGLAKALGYVTPADLLPQCGAGIDTNEGLSRVCYYEAYVRIFVLKFLNMTSSGFLPSQSIWGMVQPTWIDDDYRHMLIEGQVSDENSYAMGGVAGHAGLFSNVPDVLKLLTPIMFAPEAPTNGFLNSTTVKLWTTAYNLTQSSRALGWDTNDYTMNTERGCANLSPLTFTHTGYTGMELCNDPTRKLITVLFTNRVYPNKTANMPEIKLARQAFNDAVLAVLEPSH